MEEVDDIPIIAIYELLTNPSASASIAATVGDRMYPVQAPDATAAPYLTYSQLSEDVISTKDGEVRNGWDFDVEIFGTDLLETRKIARAVRRTLSGMITDVENIGNVRLIYVEEIDAGYNEKLELFTTALFFRAKK